ncbi:SurA N-terminal domain-containing protein [Frankia sp. AgPm24]|uniref:SurA N-terminal domain-containing protein n=1 Tax=Frankia sp. AgPm24 TaxID=631128 RepID=UPI0020105B08|nr:SurA N-terminal domain-containing protein [Frankia sp. AgPm24]MCK9923541.1 SurA N-terminal domain-containing protein [Frankia sp. AgPm24]
MKLPRLLAGVGLSMTVVLAASACTTHAGAAAQVGSHAIETSQLRSIVERGLSAAQAVPPSPSGQSAASALDQPSLQRRTLTTLVQLQLMSDEAHRRGITVSDADVSAYYQAYAILQFGSVRAFEQRAAAVGFAQRDVAVIVRSGAIQSALSDRISPTLVATDAQTRSQYDSIVSQVGRIPLTYARAKPYLARFIAADVRAAALKPILDQAEKKNPISVNPRFGRWDTAQFGIVAADGTIASSVVPPPTLDTTLQS